MFNLYPLYFSFLGILCIYSLEYIIKTNIQMKNNNLSFSGSLYDYLKIIDNHNFYYSIFLIFPASITNFFFLFYIYAYYNLSFPVLSFIFAIIIFIQSSYKISEMIKIGSLFKNTNFTKKDTFKAFKEYAYSTSRSIEKLEKLDLLNKISFKEAKTFHKNIISSDLFYKDRDNIIFELSNNELFKLSESINPKGKVLSKEENINFEGIAILLEGFLFCLIILLENFK